MLIGHPVYQHGFVICTSAHEQYAKIRLFQHFNFLHLLYLVFFVTSIWNIQLKQSSPKYNFFEQFIRLLSRWLLYYLFFQFFQSCSPAVCRSSLSHTSLWVPFESLFCYGACRFFLNVCPIYCKEH